MVGEGGGRIAADGCCPHPRYGPAPGTPLLIIQISLTDAYHWDKSCVLYAGVLETSTDYRAILTQ